jgi:acyl-CoA thioester hydrolase
MTAPAYRHAREVAFGDTDASGWMHFPNVFRYVEEAEHALLKSLGLLVFDRAQGGWPRVNVSCDFAKPLLTGDRIEVCLSLEKIGNSSLVWHFEIIMESGGTAASGNITTVRVNHEGIPQALGSDERTALTPLLRDRPA